MTPQFLDPLDVRQIDWCQGRPLWRTLAPLRYESAILGGVVVVPAGFVTDLASTPRMLLTWFLAGGRAPRPAVVHDFGYQFGYVVLEDGAQRPVDRAAMDAAFDEAMKADPFSGTNAFTRTLMWAAVRVGGRGVWAEGDERAEFLESKAEAARLMAP